MCLFQWCLADGALAICIFLDVPSTADPGEERLQIGTAPRAMPQDCACVEMPGAGDEDPMFVEQEPQRRSARQLGAAAVYRHGRRVGEQL